MDKKFNISMVGDETTSFLSRSGMLLANGYNRIVIDAMGPFGDRAPYIEFYKHHIIHDNIAIPNDQVWRLAEEFSYVLYHLYASKCSNAVKVLYMTTSIRDSSFTSDRIYISPYDLLFKQHKHTRTMSAAVDKK